MPIIYNQSFKGGASVPKTTKLPNSGGPPKMSSFGTKLSRLGTTIYKPIKTTAKVIGTGAIAPIKYTQQLAQAAVSLPSSAIRKVASKIHKKILESRKNTARQKINNYTKKANSNVHSNDIKAEYQAKVLKHTAKLALAEANNKLRKARNSATKKYYYNLLNLKKTVSNTYKDPTKTAGKLVNMIKKVGTVITSPSSKSTIKTAQSTIDMLLARTPGTRTNINKIVGKTEKNTTTNSEKAKLAVFKAQSNLNKTSQEKFSITNTDGKKKKYTVSQIMSTPSLITQFKKNMATRPISFGKGKLKDILNKQEIIKFQENKQKQATDTQPSQEATKSSVSATSQNNISKMNKELIAQQYNLLQQKNKITVSEEPVVAPVNTPVVAQANILSQPQKTQQSQAAQQSQVSVTQQPQQQSEQQSQSREGILLSKNNTTAAPIQRSIINPKYGLGNVRSGDLYRNLNRTRTNITSSQTNTKYKKTPKQGLFVGFKQSFTNFFTPKEKNAKKLATRPLPNISINKNSTNIIYGNENYLKNPNKKVSNVYDNMSYVSDETKRRALDNAQIYVNQKDLYVNINSLRSGNNTQSTNEPIYVNQETQKNIYTPYKPHQIATSPMNVNQEPQPLYENIFSLSSGIKPTHAIQAQETNNMKKKVASNAINVAKTESNKLAQIVLEELQKLKKNKSSKTTLREQLENAMNAKQKEKIKKGETKTTDILYYPHMILASYKAAAKKNLLTETEKQIFEELKQNETKFLNMEGW